MPAKNHITYTNNTTSQLLRSSEYHFGLLKAEFALLAYVSLLVGVVIALINSEQSLWVSLGIVFFIFNVGHMFFTASRYIILPGLMSFIASINLIIAPWLAYSYKSTTQLFNMSVPQEQYFSFAVPATIALWLGAHLTAVSGIKGDAVIHEQVNLTSQEQRVMDALIVGGILLTVISEYVPSGLGFLLYILAQLRFVAALSWMFTNTSGWQKRVILVYSHLLLLVAGGGLFYEFVLWSGYLLICIAWVRKWRMKLFIALISALCVATFLNGIKSDYRFIISKNKIDDVQKVKLLGSLLWDSISSANETFFSTNTGDRIVRFNQGWIVARIQKRVPDGEPYASGETIVSAIVASIVPRFLVPEKLGAVSKELFKKYTGHELSQSTSMALGVVGEMYANFGTLGGIFAIFVYGLIVGRLFSFFATKAQTNILWYAWLPFTLLWVVEAEWNLVDIMNHFVKSFMVMIFLITIYRKSKIRLFHY